MSKKGRVGALVVVFVLAGSAAWLLARRGSSELRDSPTQLSAIGAELFAIDASAITRRGPPRVWVVRLGKAVELVPHHYNSHTSAELQTPQPIDVWADALGAPVVFNAGQFDENLVHLGWLKADGNWIVERRHAKFMGLLVSGPLEGAPWAGVIDLQQSSAAIAERYRHVVQSMMLLDDQGRLRVRDSDKSACRTVIAQDARGRLLILVSEGAMTLGDLGRWLPGTGLDIVRAMNMDGGIEAQLAIRTAEVQMSLFGQYGTGTTMLDAGPGQIRYPLPAVVAVRPME